MADSWALMLVRVADKSSTDVKNKITNATVGTYGSSLGRRAATAMSRLLISVAAGTDNGNLYLSILDNSATFATGNIACTRANAANDTITFTFGAKTVVLTEGVDYLRGATDTTCAANLAAAINAHDVLGDLITALGSSGNCGLTAKIPTALAHSITLSTGDATAFTLTAFASGTVGTAEFFLQDFTLNRTA